VGKSRRKVIMIIEDDPARRKRLYEVAKLTGSDLLSASSGGEALQRIPREQPDLILINLFSEKVLGMDFLRALRGFGLGKKIPVLAMLHEEQRELAVSYGTNEIFELDPPPHKLLEKICQHLGINRVELPNQH
jgi:CheY-like chemotaxis protein